MLLVKTSQGKSVLIYFLGVNFLKVEERCKPRDARPRSTNSIEGGKDENLFFRIFPGTERNSFSANGEQLFKKRC